MDLQQREQGRRRGHGCGGREQDPTDRPPGSPGLRRPPARSCAIVFDRGERRVLGPPSRTQLNELMWLAHACVRKPQGFHSAKAVVRKSACDWALPTAWQPGPPEDQSLDYAPRRIVRSRRRRCCRRRSRSIAVSRRYSVGRADERSAESWFNRKFQRRSRCG